MGYTFIVRVEDEDEAQKIIDGHRASGELTVTTANIEGDGWNHSAEARLIGWTRLETMSDQLASEQDEVVVQMPHAPGPVDPEILESLKGRPIRGAETLPPALRRELGLDTDEADPS